MSVICCMAGCSNRQPQHHLIKVLSKKSLHANPQNVAVDHVAVDNEISCHFIAVTEAGMQFFDCKENIIHASNH